MNQLGGQQRPSGSEWFDELTENNSHFPSQAPAHMLSPLGEQPPQGNYRGRVFNSDILSLFLQWLQDARGKGGELENQVLEEGPGEIPGQMFPRAPMQMQPQPRQQYDLPDLRAFQGVINGPQ